jgi:hypothetical protein
MRRRSQPHSFEDQITAQKALLVEQVALLDNGPEREKLLEKIRQLETVLHLNGWLKPQALQTGSRTPANPASYSASK